MKIEHIREFLEVTETLNYSIAAKNLYTSQSAITRHIQAMEKELGVKLFDTSSHGVTLTDAGKLAAVSLLNVINEYDRYLEKNSNYTNSITGTLRLGLLYYAIDDVYSGILDHFRGKYPGVQLKCRSYQPQELYEDILNGKVDAGTLFYSDAKDVSDMEGVKVSESGMVVILQEEDPLTTESSVRLEDLEGHPIVELSDDEFSNRVTRSMLKKNKVRYTDCYSAGDLEMVPSLIRKRGGFHLTGESCKRQNGAGVVYIPVAGSRVRFSFGFFHLKENRNPLIEVFMNEVKAYSAKQ